MSARFSEPCRERPLLLTQEEDVLRRRNSAKPPCHTCERDAFVGVFFDGTNNNKYRDLPNNAASNIARLFEAYIGNPAAASATYGGKPSSPLKPSGFDAKDFPFYRKIYIPGVGTACPEVNDPGENENHWLPNVMTGDKTRGLAMATFGHARIRYALLQLLNQIGVMFLGQYQDLSPARIQALITWNDPDTVRARTAYGTEREAFASVLRDISQKLAERTASARAIKPKVRSLRLSVFGFSRGAAAARAFVNELVDALGSSIAGIPLTIDMEGLFDTVASVGVAHLGSIPDGHMAWADGENLVIPDAVLRCVHLVSAHEVRMCFPLDSVGQNGHTPARCKEIVYPGVHSDVGGGYGLWDQGRIAADADKISQISLAQMYREARMAGVPFAASNEMLDALRQMFAISDTLKADFNAYVAKTRIGTVDPANNKGMLLTMFPSETQPPELLETVIHRHYGHCLAWRKFRLNDIDRTPGLQHSVAMNNSSARQDVYDIWQANEQLKLELKPEHLGWVSKMFLHMANGTDPGFDATRSLWARAKLSAANDQALIRLFDLYVHDSRAWFKLGGESDDEWFGGGNDAKGKVRQSKKAAYRAKLLKQRQNFEALSAKHKYDDPMLAADYADYVKAIDKEIALYEKWGDTLQAKGESAQEGISFGAGYLRWRTIYSTQDSRRNNWNVQQYDMCVLNNETRRAQLKQQQERLRALQAEQSRTIQTFLNNAQAIRREASRNGNAEQLASIDKSIALVLRQITPAMGQQNSAIEARIKALEDQLGTPCEAPRSYQEAPLSVGH